MIRVFKGMGSPIGPLKLVGGDAGLAAVLWENDHRSYRHLDMLVEDAAHPVLVEAEQQLRDYFDGRRKVFSIPLDFEGTDFQKQVWTALLAIPFGESRSYGEVARMIGRPKAVRAVGAAAGKNPIAVIAPCHRVLGATGTLTGFAGGLTAKTRLLAIEGLQSGRLARRRPRPTAGRHRAPLEARQRCASPWAAPPLTFDRKPR